MTQPTNADIQWDLEHQDLLAVWLERRGGLRWGDQVMRLMGDGKPSRRQLVTDASYFLTTVPNTQWLWLPSVGDVLEMLEEWGARRISVGRSKKYEDGPLSRRYSIVDMGSNSTGYGETRLIGLLELLKTLEA